LKAADAKKLTLDQLEQKALVSRADLSALNWRCLAAEATYREAAAGRIPWFNFLQGSYAVSSQDEKGGIGSGLAPPGSLSDYSMADASEWRVDAAINLPLLGWLNDTPALRMAEYQQLKTQLAEKIKNIYQSFQDALDTMHSLGERQAMYDTESEPVLRDMQKVLDSLSSGTGMSPDQIMRVKEQMLELQRLKLEQDHEFRLGIVNLEETLGTWLAPIEWR
jgi:outer membrane protein TolC